MLKSTHVNWGNVAMKAKIIKKIRNVFSKCFSAFHMSNVQGYTLEQLSQLNVQMHCDCFLIISNSCSLSPITSWWLEVRAPGWRGSYSHHFSFPNIILCKQGFIFASFTSSGSIESRLLCYQRESKEVRNQEVDVLFSRFIFHRSTALSYHVQWRHQDLSVFFF